MSYRSEANYIPNKQNYRDLKMTQYPNTLDTRTNNENMRGFVNVGETQAVPDFVMAEYTNALIDGVMAIQRALGNTPMVYHGARETDLPELIENSTISDRITRIEDGLFDVRYGGEGWTYTPGRPVLNNHRHTGRDGQPPQIDLTKEVINLLPYVNIDLNYRTGLTGAHISLSPSNPTKLNEIIADLLSKSQGGRVTGPVTFTGVTKSRTHMDATASDIGASGQATLISDNQATSGRALSSGSTTSQRRLFRITASDKEQLLYGRYVLGLRLKKNDTRQTGANLLEVNLGSQSEYYSEDVITEDYKTIHFIFEQNASTKGQSIDITKLHTGSNREVVVDNYYITPIHPATLDR